MNSIILIVEDKEREIEKAVSAVSEIGLSPVVATNLQDAKNFLEEMKIVGIITDLHFPESDNREDEQLCGLAMVAIAAQKNIPVAK